MALQKTYIYKVSRAGAFLGTLQNVKGPFTFTQQIGTAFAAATIEVGQSPYTASIPAPPLETELGQPFQTEDGNTLTLEKSPDIFGNATNNILIRSNNTVEVVEYSTNYPNGKTVFKGYITYWEAQFTPPNYSIIVNLSSHGIELDNYIINNGRNILLQQLQFNATFTVVASASPWNYEVRGIQRISNRSDKVQAVVFLFTRNNTSNTTAKLRVYLFQMVGANPHASADTLIATSNDETATSGIATSSSGIYTQVLFDFPTPPTLNPANTYYFEVAVVDAYANSPNFTMYAYNADVYAGGEADGYGINTPTNGVNTLNTFSAVDMYFAILGSTSATATTSSFLGYDPAQMFKEIIDNYVSQGGSINYSGSSIDMTGSNQSYTFITATTLEGIKKALELSPSTWYWYVDPATDVIYFKQTATTATHKIILGRHFASLKVRGTVENVINKVIFTGGLVGTTNLLSLYPNADSITALAGRVLLKRLSDNRVTVQATADTLANNTLADHPNEEYTVQIRIYDNTYDIQTINLGDTMSIIGNANFIDNLILQISQITRAAEYVDLVLGPLLDTETGNIAQAQRDITALQTVANPSAPS